MSQVIQRESATVGLQVRQRRNRELLAELLADYRLVDVEESVPGAADLCIVDEGGLERSRGALADWKAEQAPTFAPVLLLASPDREDPWSRYADRLSESIDAIMQVPMPRRAILAEVESLLKTRRFALELARERELNKRIFETSPVANTVLDTDGTIIQANRRAQDVLGLEISALEGRAYDDPELTFSAPDGQPLSPEERPFDRVTSTGEPVYNQEVAFERPDGETVRLSVNMAPVLDDEGGIGYLVAAMDDVTEERRLERELRASEELHRTTLEGIADTVVITDEDGRFTYVCPNTEQLFDWTTEEVEALGDVESLLGTDPAPDDLDEVGLIENVELQVVDAAGDEHTVLVTVKAVSIQHGSRLYTVRDITERAAAERALQETTESRSIALEAADAGVWEWDSETEEIDLDDSLERLIDIPAALDGLEDLFERRLHPDDRPRIEAAVDRAIESGEPFDVTIRMVAGEDEIRWLQTRGRTLTDDAGEPTRLLGVAIDVTERITRERELEQYERIVETAPDPIYALDAEGVITLANGAFATIFGADADDLIGTDIESLLRPENVEASLEHIRTLRSGDTDPAPLELTIGTGEGPRDYEVNIALHGAGVDERQGTVGMAHDVTERRKRERLLRRAQRAVEASGHAIYITDPDGRIVYANTAFERVTGYPADEAIGRTPAILQSAVTDEAHFEAMWRTITAGEVWDEEIVNERRNGERYHADQTIAPIIDDGEIEGYVAIQTDVTGHKNRLQQLQVMDRVLRHNLHNALNVVLGHADLILEETDGRPAEDAATILRKGEELLDLVDKQRSITQTLSAEPAIESIDLVPLVEHIAEEFIEDHPDIELAIELPEEAVVRTTEDLQKAVRKLLQNAVEHADRPAPTVRVVVERADDAIELRVIDDGPGIPAMDREVVTGEERVEPLYHGSGLGLWLVSWIVRRSGASLEFADNEPRGTVVTIRLEPADQAT